ncbi:YbaB/EbfC family nucleoid-associated protein [Candidatus Absconditicoccus praedator]|uniref:YbaB/EbfC family nucleoid-associated protein n=1 Tax=Candidatus Absconditicoccus praedator TaxID=2735562 RepID=UPI001E3E4BF3|nr:YbaB/EbfC family nucleoid-associated protein [Candidatus Absconditicoccus praedator]UFX83457.1 YbaB/EbfC family nucleoid-associated protein [Candidatus Absconditicoccus praedator]
MFGNLGDMKQMYDKYKKLQETLKNTVIRAREGGVLIDITAEMKIKNVKIEDESLLDPNMKESLEEAIKASIEKGQNKAQEVAMQKTKDTLGFDPNDIASMMGGGGGGGMPNMPGLK